VGEVGSGLETIHLVNELRPDVLILDLTLGDMDGMDVARRLQNSSPETDVVIYSMYSYESYILKAQQLGVKGYVLKKSPPLELVKAIRAVLAGGHYFVPPLHSG
jgi:DNA-binding NarL/FixJ family response regulator